MKPKMIIMRGLPGSGKDTMLRAVLPKGGLVCSANDFFMEDGEYKFVPWKIGHAHESCKLKCFRAMTEGKHVAISNTNTQVWEYRFYLAMAAHFEYAAEIHNLFDGGCTNAELAERNVHGVPEEVIGRMRRGYEQPNMKAWSEARQLLAEAEESRGGISCEADRDTVAHDMHYALKRIRMSDGTPVKDFSIDLVQGPQDGLYLCVRSQAACGGVGETDHIRVRLERKQSSHDYSREQQ